MKFLSLRSISGYDNYSAYKHSYEYTVKVSTLIQRGLDNLEQQRKDAEATHLENLPELERNKEYREKISALMKEAGIKSLWYGLRRGSSSKKTVTLNAGYVEDMARDLPVEDGYDRFLTSYESEKKRHTEALQKALREEEQAQRRKDQAAENQKQEAQKTFDKVSLLVKYGLNPLDGWWEILEAVLNKSPLLNLAHAMLQAREDFSLGRCVPFAVSDAIPKEVRDDVLAAYHVWCEDGDGRVFRDCAHNYDSLFHVVAKEAPELYADYKRADEEVRREEY